VQIGSAEALFERPAHTFVGHFIGSPGMNFLAARAAGGRVTVAEHEMAAPRALPEGELKIGVRPEYVTLAEAQAEGALPGTVTQLQDIGTHRLLTAKVNGSTVKARLAPEIAVPALGQPVWLQLVNRHTCWYVNEELVAS
jgi:glycerol transport system ATP-binding protein